MRIGIITGEYPPRQGGVGAYTQILARHFADLGHDVSVLCRADAHEDDNRIHLHNMVTKWRFNTLNAIKRWVNERDLDIVNLQFETAAYDMSGWVHFIPRYTGDVPLVTTFHDLLVPYLFPKAGPLRRWIVMHLAQSSQGVIVTNHEDEHSLHDITAKTLIPIGSNIDMHMSADFDRVKHRQDVGAGEHDFLIAYFGFLNRSKGVELLLDSLADLTEQGYPVRLVMIGGRTGTSDPANAAYAREIDAQIDRLKLTPHMHRTGYLDDKGVSALLHASDAVALPFQDGASYRRGSLMAAIHHGCAIITTTPHVDISTFVHGENILLISPHTANDTASPHSHISQAILSLYHDPVLAKKLRCGAKELSQVFAWSFIADEYIRFFRQISGVTA